LCFFKQKTTYKMDTRLEFRRVLFRSAELPALRRLRPVRGVGEAREAPRPRSRALRRGHGWSPAGVRRGEGVADGSRRGADGQPDIGRASFRVIVWVR